MEAVVSNASLAKKMEDLFGRRLHVSNHPHSLLLISKMLASDDALVGQVI